MHLGGSVCGGKRGDEKLKLLFKAVRPHRYPHPYSHSHHHQPCQASRNDIKVLYNTGVCYLNLRKVQDAFRTIEVSQGGG